MKREKEGEELKRKIHSLLQHHFLAAASAAAIAAAPDTEQAQPISSSNKVDQLDSAPSCLARLDSAGLELFSKAAPLHNMRHNIFQL